MILLSVSRSESMVVIMDWIIALKRQTKSIPGYHDLQERLADLANAQYGGN